MKAFNADTWRSTAARLGPRANRRAGAQFQRTIRARANGGTPESIRLAPDRRASASPPPAKRPDARRWSVPAQPGRPQTPRTCLPREAWSMGQWPSSQNLTAEIPGSAAERAEADFRVCGHARAIARGRRARQRREVPFAIGHRGRPRLETAICSVHSCVTMLGKRERKSAPEAPRMAIPVRKFLPRHSGIPFPHRKIRPMDAAFAFRDVIERSDGDQNDEKRMLRAVAREFRLLDRGFPPSLGKEEARPGTPNGGGTSLTGPLPSCTPIYGVAGAGAGAGTTTGVPLPAGASGMISWI